MERIVDDLKEKGSDREWCIRAQRRLQEGKRYLKTDYRVHCTEDSSPCKDHCRKFALSDPVEKDFKEECDHGHHLRCYMCEALKDVVNDINCRERYKATDSWIICLYVQQRISRGSLVWLWAGQHWYFFAPSALVVMDWAMKSWIWSTGRSSQTGSLKEVSAGMSRPSFLTAARLAQLVECQSAVREVEVRAPDRTNTQGLKTTEENVLPL